MIELEHGLSRQQVAGGGKVDVVQLVGNAADAQLVLARDLGLLRSRPLRRQQRRGDRGVLVQDADAQFAVAAERQAQVEADLARGTQELRHLGAVGVGIERAVLAVAGHVGRGEPVGLVVDVAPQRVVDLREDRWLLAHLHEVAPLGAVLVEPVHGCGSA